MKNTDVTAKLRYLIPGDSKPVYIASRGGADAALKIGADFEDRAVTIHDARQLARPAELDRDGRSGPALDTQRI